MPEYTVLTGTHIKQSEVHDKSVKPCGGLSFCFNPNIYLRVLFKQKFTYFEVKVSSFSLKDFSKSEVKH